MSSKFLSSKPLTKHRKKFIIKSFGLFAFFLVLSLIHWFIFFIDSVTKFVCQHRIISFAMIFTAVIILSIFVFIESVRLYQPVNWIVAFIIIEAFILSVAWFVCITCPEAMAYCILASIIPLLVAIIIGFFTARDLTLDVILIFIISFALMMSALYAMCLFLLINISGAVILIIGTTFGVVFMFTMYHAQTIVGNGNSEIHLKDYLLAAIILYVDFFIMYMLVMMLFSRVWSDTDNCFKDINYHQENYPKYMRRFLIDPYANESYGMGVSGHNANGEGSTGDNADSSGFNNEESSGDSKDGNSDDNENNDESSDKSNIEENEENNRNDPGSETNEEAKTENAMGDGTD